MAKNRFNGFSDFGVGIGLRIPHYGHILSHTPPVEWFEIISENFLLDGGRPLHILDQILEKYRVVMHGVSLCLGSPKELNTDHLHRLKKLAEYTKTPWMSDHLCWGSVDGTYSHDLLPLPYTEAVVQAAAEKIMRVRDYIGVPIAVENLSSYVEFNASSMTEWEFLTKVVEAADCGILLDVNNIYVSSVNHHFNPLTYIENIPLERVAQIHIAGHSPHDRFIIDTHDRAPIDPVWELYAAVIKKIGRTPTLLEWDSKIPSFEDVFAEANKACQWLNTQPAADEPVEIRA